MRAFNGSVGFGGDFVFELLVGGRLLYNRL